MTDILPTKAELIEAYRIKLIEAVGATNAACGMAGLRPFETLYEVELAVAAFARGLEAQ